jgi:hypothetical protein
MGFSNYARIVSYVTVERDMVKGEFDDQHNRKPLWVWLREKLASKYSIKCPSRRGGCQLQGSDEGRGKSHFAYQDLLKDMSIFLAFIHVHHVQRSR